MTHHQLFQTIRGSETIDTTNLYIVYCLKNIIFATTTVCMNVLGVIEIKVVFLK